jgi:hypothetical protein
MEQILRCAIPKHYGMKSEKHKLVVIPRVFEVKARV